MMRALDMGERPPEKRIGPWRGADSEADRHGLNASNLHRRRTRFNYHDHPLAAKLIAISIARCGGTWRLPS
jgi:hypothetical protein